jgi:hypothetical protein
MSLTPENELTIRRKIADKAGSVEHIGFVLPAPVDFADKEDFWATVAPKDTREALETTPVKFCAIYPLQSEDVPENGQSEPLILLTYEFYLFHERTSARKDESAVPDVFNKKLLKTHSDFVAAWLDLRTEFLGRQQLNLGAEFAVAQTNSLRQPDEIRNNAKCEFVPGIRGFEVRLRLDAKILLKEC